MNICFFCISKFIRGKWYQKNIVHEVKEKDDWCSGVAGHGLGSVNIGLFVSRKQERIVFVDDGCMLSF